MTKHYREAYDMFASCGILFNHESPLRGLEFVTRRISYEISQIKYKKKKDKIHLGNLKAKKELKWRPKVNFKQLVKMMVEHDLDYFRHYTDPFEMKN